MIGVVVRYREGYLSNIFTDFWFLFSLSLKTARENLEVWRNEKTKKEFSFERLLKTGKF